MQIIGLCIVAYGILKGQLYRKSKSLAGKRLGLGIALVYIGVGLTIFIRSLFLSS